MSNFLLKFMNRSAKNTLWGHAFLGRSKSMAAICLLLCFGATPTLLLAQKTTIFTEANLHYKRGLDLYEKGVYALAQGEFERAIQQVRPAAEPESKLLRGRAELYYAKSAVRLGQPNAEQLILDFIRNYSPEPLAVAAIYEMGNYYFAAEDYERSAKFYNMLNAGDVTSAQRSEVAFKKGYSLFVRRDFKGAKQAFSGIREEQGEYYLPTNYYYGMIAFFENDFDEAVKSFQRVEKSQQYAQYVPYYLVQIYSAQKDYDKVITYGEKLAIDSKVKNYREINQLVGQAYFEKKDFEKAERFLSVGAEGNNRMREEDFYQLGFCQHRLGKYKEAAENLQKLNTSQSKMSQNALFMLGDCYLKLGDRNAARTAFGSASRMNADPSVQEDALWNYAKLSYELKFTQDAVNILEGFSASSKYYNEAQNLLGDVLLQTRNYEEALSIIGKMGNKTPKIREAYQKALVYRGIQLMQENKANEAQSYFQRSLSDALNAEARAIAQYWLGEIEHQQKDYAQSVNYINQFLTFAKTARGALPNESSVHTGNYLQGYNYLKQKNYTSALQFFTDCVNGIKSDNANLYSDFVKQNVIGDATLRAADCHFKRNQYNEALKLYDEAIAKQYSGFVYALYQKGIIQGLRNNNVDKIIALEKLAEQYPNSEFTPMALLEVGVTYQQTGKLDRAAQTLNKLVQQYKRSPMVNQAYLRLGLIATNQGNSEQAITYYKAVFSNNPTAQEARAARDRLEDIYVNDLGKPDDFFAFMRSTGYSVDNAKQDSISFRAAETQFEQGNYEKAIPNYTTYISRYPNGTNILQAYYNRGDAYANLQQYDNALSDYEQVVNRGNSRYYARATEKAALIAYNHAKNFQKAMDLYIKMEQAATTDDKRFEAELGAMRSAYRIGNTNVGSDMANKVANNSRATKEQQINANFYIGKIAYDKKDLDRARVALQKAYQGASASEQTDEAGYLLASVRYLQRDLNEALSICEKVSQNATSNFWAAKSTILEADIYAEKGDLFNARAALEAVIDNFKDNPEILREAQAKLEALKQKEAQKSRLDKTKPSNKNPLIEMDKDN